MEDSYTSYSTCIGCIISEVRLKRKGSPFISTFVLITAIISNLSEYLVTGPFFGGMSGVVYALFGYVWIKSKFDPGDGLFIDQSTAIILLAWFFLCFTMPVGTLSGGGVANFAHAGGHLRGIMGLYFCSPLEQKIIIIIELIRRLLTSTQIRENLTCCFPISPYGKPSFQS